MSVTYPGIAMVASMNAKIRSLPGKCIRANAYAASEQKKTWASMFTIASQVLLNSQRAKTFLPAPAISTLHVLAQFSKCHSCGKKVGGKAVTSRLVLKVPRKERMNGINT